MKTIEELRAYFAGDHFAAAQGIGIDEVDASGAVCSLLLSDRQKNALGYAQGGLLFTLADFAFAVAANASGGETVTLNSTIHCIKGVQQGKITATARLQSRARTVCVYEIRVTDAEEALLALATITGYTLHTNKPSA